MKNKIAISILGVFVFAGLLGSMPIEAKAAELSVYVPGGVSSAVRGAAAAGRCSRFVPDPSCRRDSRPSQFLGWGREGAQDRGRRGGGGRPIAPAFI